MPARAPRSLTGPLAVVLVVAAMVVTVAGPATPSAWRWTAAIGAVDLGTAVDMDTADSRRAVDTGGVGVVHYPGAEPAGRALQRLAPRSRLHYTGVFGLEPTLGVLADGTVVTQGSVRKHVDDYDFGVQPVVIRSTDGGATWDDASPGTHLTTQDPYLAVDPTTGRIFTTDWVGCTQISSSDDAGATWQPRGPVCGEVLDHQTLFTGPPVISTPIGYPNVVYLCGISYGFATPTSAGTQCTKSLDGGTTFVMTGEPAFLARPGAGAGSFGVDGACDGASGHGAVGPDGTVYVPKGYCGQPYLAISHDEGLTWQRVQVADNGMNRQSNGTPDHEAAVVADAHGNVFYSWVSEDRLPYLAVSRDGGVSWDEPLMIAAPGVAETVLPGMAIGPDGALALVYMGSTNSPGPPFAADGYDDVTWNGYVTYVQEPTADRPLLATVSLNDPAQPLIHGTCGPFRCQAEFDFIDVQFGPDGTPWASLVDGCGPGLYALPPADDHGCHTIGELVIGQVLLKQSGRPL